MECAHLAATPGKISGFLAAVGALVLCLSGPAQVRSAAVGAIVQTSPAAAGVDAAMLARLLSLPRATHQSDLRVDVDASRGMTRVWINTNEDDGRLWSRVGGQMDMEFRVSALVPALGAGTPPAHVSLDFATLGELRPIAGSRALELRADGRAVPVTQEAQAEYTSGGLLFLATKATLSLADFVRMAISERVEGRIWGHEFVLQSAQLELLRALAARLVGVG